MRTVICQLALGYTRTSGYVIFNSENKEFEETTPKITWDLAKKGEVNGLLVNKDGELVLDTEGFNMTNLMIKSAVGRYRTLLPTSSIINCAHAVVRILETDNGKLYETINNRCGRVKITPDRLKILMEVGCVAGVKIGADGQIEICKGVIIEDKRTKVEQIEVNKLEQVLSVEVAEKAAEKSAESVGDENINPVEQDANGSEIVFDNIEATEVNADDNTTSDDTSINLDNAEGNNGENPSPEQAKDKKKTATRNTRKK